MSDMSFYSHLQLRTQVITPLINKLGSQHYLCRTKACDLFVWVTSWCYVACRYNTIQNNLSNIHAFNFMADDNLCGVFLMKLLELRLAYDGMFMFVNLMVVSSEELASLM
eukprot:6492285-Amphidinium_carterae.4